MSDEQLREQIAKLAAERLAEQFTSARWEWNEDKTDYRPVDSPSDRVDRGMCNVITAGDGHPSLTMVTPNEATAAMLEAVWPAVSAALATARQQERQASADDVEAFKERILARLADADPTVRTMRLIADEWLTAAVDIADHGFSMLDRTVSDSK